MSRLRLVVRQLSRSKTYSVAVILVLGIGISFATVVVALVDGVLFKPLPYDHAAELHVIRPVASASAGSNDAFSWNLIRAWRKEVPHLSLTGVTADLTEFHHDGRRYLMAGVDEQFFTVLGVTPLVGMFDQGDFDLPVDQSSVIRPILITARFWQEAFGNDAGVVGQTFVTSEREGQTFGLRVVGILKSDFVFPVDDGAGQPDLLYPIPIARRRTGASEYQTVVRLHAGASHEVLQHQLSATFAAIPPSHRSSNSVIMGGRAVVLESVSGHLGHHQRSPFALIVVSGGALLLLACTNVAGLVAARVVDRRRELAIHRAMGAGGWVLWALVVTEVAVLLLAALSLALLLVNPLLAWTMHLLPASVALLKNPAIDVRVLALAAAMTAACVLLVSLWPARLASRLGVTSALTGLAGSATRASHSRSWVLAGQVALGLTLLTLAGLAAGSAVAAWRNDTGFRRDGVLFVEAYVKRYRTAAHAIRQLTDFRDELAGIPGVAGVAVSSIQPTFARRGVGWSSVRAEGFPTLPAGITSRHVSHDFFAIMGLRLIEGRLPSGAEWEGGQNLAILSETASRRLWPGQSAIQKILEPANARRSPADQTFTVVGVVADARFSGADEDPTAEIYLPGAMTANRTGLFFHVQLSSGANEALSRLRQLAASADLRVEQATTHRGAMVAGLKPRLFSAWLFGAMGAAGLLILGAGVFGMIAVSVSERTREFGLRLALGATSRTIRHLILREQILAVCAGLLVGSVLAYWAARAFSARLYGITPLEPIVWLAAIATILFVTFLATIIPTLRIGRLQPTDALRSD